MLATAFLREKHEAMLGTRNTSKPEVQKWNSENAKGQIGTFAEVAAFGEVLVLAVAGSAAEEALNESGIKI